MGLFKKKPQYTEQKVRCVHCGRTHTLRKYFAEEYYLDGMPKLPPEQLLAQHALCDCGALVYPNAEWNPVSKEMMQSEVYQQALRLQGYERLLCLTQIVFPESLPDWLNILHLSYSQETANKCLELSRHPDAVMYPFDSKRIKQINFPKGKFEYCAELSEIDLLRQTGQWDMCLQKINQMRNRKFPPISEKRKSFLNLEEQLVLQRDNRLR